MGKIEDTGRVNRPAGDAKPGPKKRGSITTAFVVYFVLCVVVAALLVTMTFSMGLELSYNNSSLGNFLSVMMFFMCPVWCIVCIGMTSRIFYKRKLKRPLTLLDAAAENIANNNLNFAVIYPVNDEMGRLCASFEKMRAALLENNREMWRVVEERRRLNAAFAHDLRTPLTVLKGQTEMLLKYVPDGTIDAEKVSETAQVMSAHIDRLEDYVSTMNSLQRLEDIELDARDTPAGEIVSRISYSSGMLSGEKTVEVDASRFTARSLVLDGDIVMQVFENLVSNALRFAEEKIKVTVSGSGVLILSVTDDGVGFNPDDIPRASDPFFRATGQEEGQHCGMGLSICKILCEKHGGSLYIENAEGGGASVTAVFASMRGSGVRPAGGPGPA